MFCLPCSEHFMIRYGGEEQTYIFVRSIWCSRLCLSFCFSCTALRRTGTRIRLPVGSFWLSVSLSLNKAVWTPLNDTSSTGVMYYFNSVWEMFYVFDRKLGPLVRICFFTFKKDLPLWFLMMLPFLVNTFLSCQDRFLKSARLLFSRCQRRWFGKLSSRPTIPSHGTLGGKLYTGACLHFLMFSTGNLNSKQLITAR